jgi:hypothetical protein
MSPKNLSTAHVSPPAYHFFGDSVVMTAKLLWNIVRRWTVYGPLLVVRTYLDGQLHDAIQSTIAELAARMSRLFADWSEIEHRARVRFFDYWRVPGVRALYHRSFRPTRSSRDLVADAATSMRYLETLAQTIFLVSHTEPADLKLVHGQLRDMFDLSEEHEAPR